jgi:DNA-binding NarL/FixJ family response regulator
VPRLADVLLLDVSGSGSGSGSAPGSVGLSDVLRAQSLPVLLFDWSENEQQLVADSLAGACGFVFKDAPAAAIVAAVESAFRGEDRSTTRTPHLRSVGRLPEPVKELSPREAEILALIADGRSNVEIAEQLFLSINSVKTYIRTLYRKAGVTRSAQCVAWGVALQRTTKVRAAGSVDPSSRRRPCRRGS